MLVDVILPLALPGQFTYNLPDDFVGKTCIGRRVLVPLGKRKVLTGIVYREHTEEIAPGVEIKEVTDVLDETPIVTSEQLRLWEWMASYYMSTLGEVMKAALPSAMKLESETCVSNNPDFIAATHLSKTQNAILDFLADGKQHNLEEIAKRVGVKTLAPAINYLLQINAVVVNENVQDAYKPKFATHVKLNEVDDVSALYDALGKAPRQQKLLGTYLEMTGYKADSVDKNQLLEQSGVSTAILKSLVDKSVFLIERIPIERNEYAASDTVPFPKLTITQSKAVQEINDLWKQKQVVLLHGVTSSGKTEVYIHLIKQALESQKQVLYLVPEIALTTQLTQRLQRVFGNQMVVYHSRFSDAERVEIYNNILNSNKAPKLILGVRSSLFLPFSNLGLVIVDEEHDASYKQQDPAPRYHARNGAIMLASFFRAKVILGTATPAIETYYNALAGKFGLVSLTDRYAGIALPTIQVVDTKEQYHKKEMAGHFSFALYDQMREELERGKQIILFQNRRGYAPLVTCPDCGGVPKCVNCNVSLTAHKYRNILTCHYCGYTIAIPNKCPDCGSVRIHEKGFGTERIEEELASLFPKAKVARMDLDTTRSKTGYQKLIDSFANHETDILVGTQMVTKGLHFDDVSLVAVMNADNMLNSPDFRCTERSFQMLEQVSGRAGRKGNQGRVVIQTRQPELSLFTYLQQHDYISFYKEQLAERKLFKYPPFTRLIEISIKHFQEEACEQAAAALQANLRQAFGGRCSNVIVPVVSRLQNQHIRQLMLKIESQASFAKAKELVSKQIIAVKQMSAGKSATFVTDVDPI